MYFVLIDLPNRWVTIHRHECRHARGHLSDLTVAQSEHLGPFDSLHAAMEATSQLGVRRGDARGRW